MLAGSPFPTPLEKQETCNHEYNEMNTLNSRSLEKINIKTYLLSQPNQISPGEMPVSEERTPRI